MYNSYYLILFLIYYYFRYIYCIYCIIENIFFDFLTFFLTLENKSSKILLALHNVEC